MRWELPPLGSESQSVPSAANDTSGLIEYLDQLVDAEHRAAVASRKSEPKGWEARA